MKGSLLNQIPLVTGKTGWPWTEESEPLPETTSDGNPWPKISIVSPSFNQGQFLEETIRSVLLQNYPNLEYIIIDGGSADNSVEIIKKYEPWLTYWIGEEDKGQSHAINKGLQRCSGEIFNWINSDDTLCKNALRQVAKRWIQFPNRLIAGSVANVVDEKIIGIVKPNAIELINFVSMRNAREKGFSWHQPGIFMPREKVSQVGGVREDLHFTMDYFLMINLLQECSVEYEPEILARFRLHENSKTKIYSSRFSLELIENLKLLYKELPVKVSSREIRCEHARILVECSDVERWDGNNSTAMKYLLKALLLSTTTAISVFHERHPLLPFIKKYGLQKHF